MYFNPRPRKEGDSRKYAIWLYANISIHALAKRATSPDSRLIFGEVISIHALAKRATTHANFLACDLGISIHALAKRATANLYNDYLYFEAKYHISDIFPL